MNFKVEFTGIKIQNQKFFKKIILEYKKIFNNSSFILREHVKKFEKEICRKFKTKYCLGLNSGTDSLLLGLRAAGIRPGDEVITVSHTYVATIAAIVHIGAKPIFVDIQDDHNIDPDLIKKKITNRTKAILVVHINGRSCDMDKILNISKKNNLKLIEDSAQAIGCKYRKKQVGTFGIVGCFSLHPMKIINVPGDGGFLITKSKKIYEKVKLLRDHGQALPKSKNLIKCFGFNSRLDNMHAAVALMKLKYIDKWVAERRKIAKSYVDKLNKHKEIVLLKYENKKFYDSYNSFVILCKSRDKLKKYLLKNGIEVFAHLAKGVHKQKSLNFKKIYLPKTESIEKSVLSLPIYPGLTEKKIKYICLKIKEFYKG